MDRSSTCAHMSWTTLALKVTDSASFDIKDTAAESSKTPSLMVKQRLWMIPTIAMRIMTVRRLIRISYIPLNIYTEKEREHDLLRK